MDILVATPESEQFEGIMLLNALDAYNRGDFSKRMAEPLDRNRRQDRRHIQFHRGFDHRNRRGVRARRQGGQTSRGL